MRSVKGSLEALEKERAVVALYRYFAWCEAMSEHYLEVRHRDDVLRSQGRHDSLPYKESMRAEMYLCLWCANLYTVIEGWRHIRLNVPEIKKLLRSPMTEILREVRNAVYHAEPFDDSRLTSLVQTGQDGSDWIIKVTAAFRVFFDSIGVPERNGRQQ